MGSVYSFSYNILTCLAFLLTLSLASNFSQINYQGLIAKQHTDRYRLTLREVWDGQRLLQQLYSEDTGEVLACESGPGSPTYQNQPLVNETQVLPGEFSWLNLTTLRQDCRQTEKAHSRAKRATRQRRLRHGRNKLRKSRRKDKLAMGRKGRLREHLMTPGTKWCGPSNMASKYTDLGASWETDRCCRKHDLCKKFILGMSKGYSTLNSNPFTISHCTCDNRFRTCLKMASTSVSKFVGNLFFNFIQTNCFVLKSEKICTERTFYGKCKKTEFQKLAHIRSNMAF